MDAHIVIDTDLGLTPAEVAAAWNAGPLATTPARVEPAPPSTYSAGLIEIIVTTMAGAGSALVVAGIQQIVNSFAEKRPELPPAEVVELKRPDGSPLIVVRRREQR